MQMKSSLKPYCSHMGLWELGEDNLAPLPSPISNFPLTYNEGFFTQELSYPKIEYHLWTAPYESGCNIVYFSDPEILETMHLLDTLNGPFMALSLECEAF